MSKGKSEKIRYKPYEQGQAYLIPPSVDELIPEDHLVRLVSKVIDEKVCSSRMLAKAVRENVMKEDKASWVSFFQWLRTRGLKGVKLIIGDKCLGMLEAVGETFPEAKYQR